MVDHASSSDRLRRFTDHDPPLRIWMPSLFGCLALILFAYGNVSLRDENAALRETIERLKSDHKADKAAWRCSTYERKGTVSEFCYKRHKGV